MTLVSFTKIDVNKKINTNSLRHKYFKKVLSPTSELSKFINKFQTGFNDPPTKFSFNTRQLSPTTISTYISNIKVFATWLLVCLVKYRYFFSHQIE